MKKIIALSIVLVMVIFLTAAVAPAGANSHVQYTFTLTDLEQGVGGGGPLFADGSAGGHVVVSVLNGQVIAHLYAASWYEIVTDESIDICFNVVQTKGPPTFPPYFCTSSAGINLPVSGTPVIITNPHGGANLLVRITPAG